LEQTCTVPCSPFSFLKVSALRLARVETLRNLTILLYQFFSIPFPFESPPHQKVSLHPKSKSPKAQKPKAKASKVKAQSKKLSVSLLKQGGAAVLSEGCDMVTEEP
jgi:hypothetical protein